MSLLAIYLKDPKIGKPYASSNSKSPLAIKFQAGAKNQ
jgi:hypothetical protein